MVVDHESDPTKTVSRMEALAQQDVTVYLGGFGSDLHAAAAAVAAQVGLEEKAHLAAGSLSLAERRRLEVARALANRPRLLLEEPFAGLNVEEVEGELPLFGRLRTEGLTMVLVEHNVPALRSRCDRVASLNSGEKLAEGRPEQVLFHPRVVEVYLGVYA